MKLSDLNNLNLDPNNLGSWPAPVKAVVIFLLCIVLLFAGYYLDTRHQLAELQKAQDKEVSLKKEYETKQEKAANLEAYKQQMIEIERSFGALLQQLPSKTEVAALLVDISRAGIQSGLEFELFKPEAETTKEFYAEMPVRLRVRGTYHEFGNFVSASAALSRIVTLHDLSLLTEKGKDANGAMIMEATAKTYRYLEREETEQEAKRERPSRGKK